MDRPLLVLAVALTLGVLTAPGRATAQAGGGHTGDPRSAGVPAGAHRRPARAPSNVPAGQSAGRSRVAAPPAPLHFTHPAPSAGGEQGQIPRPGLAPHSGEREGRTLDRDVDLVTGRIPGPGDRVRIRGGTTVVFDAAGARVACVTVDGRLAFATATDTGLSLQDLRVNETGELGRGHAGGPDSPFRLGDGHVPEPPVRPGSRPRAVGPRAHRLRDTLRVTGVEDKLPAAGAGGPRRGHGRHTRSRASGVAAGRPADPPDSRPIHGERFAKYGEAQSGRASPRTWVGRVDRRGREQQRREANPATRLRSPRGPRPRRPAQRGDARQRPAAGQAAAASREPQPKRRLPLRGSVRDSRPRAVRPPCRRQGLSLPVQGPRAHHGQAARQHSPEPRRHGSPHGGQPARPLRVPLPPRHRPAGTGPLRLSVPGGRQRGRRLSEVGDRRPRQLLRARPGQRRLQRPRRLHRDRDPRRPST